MDAQASGWCDRRARRRGPTRTATGRLRAPARARDVRGRGGRAADRRRGDECCRPRDLAYLITADLLVCGIATLIQCIGFWRFGVRLPIMQGCTFAAVSPMVLIGTTGGGLPAIYGSVIVAGLLIVLLAAVFGRLLRFFPPLVTGTVILIIGLSLHRRWRAAGSAEGPGECRAEEHRARRLRPRGPARCAAVRAGAS